VIGCLRSFHLVVMAGLGPAIHDFTDSAQDVDSRHTGGHDDQPGSP